MSYSDAFDRLYTMTLDAPLQTSPRYKRVSLYIFHVMTLSSANHRRKFVGSSNGKKDIVIEHLCGLPDSEWSILQATMLDYAINTGVKEWSEKRVGWVCELDTIRAFR